MARPRYGYFGLNHPGVREAVTRFSLDNRKMSLGCADCGYRRFPESLHFDHRPGEIKRFGVGKSLTYSVESQVAEIAKCDIVCANCHSHRSRVRGQHTGKRSGGRARG